MKTGKNSSANSLRISWDIAIQDGSGVGLGIGLFICKSIVEQHQGQVGVQSTRGVGSTFWFRLPLQRSAQD